jgi:nucleoid DNA-binding protein
MNRTDILRKCVDRGVAGETEVGAVSHLFYVYLLSALQRGQRVEVPGFGTFGTRVAGVRKVRKIPFFEPERELGEKVNSRFKELKYLVVGKYDQIPAMGEAVYAGREPQYDALVEQLGRERVLDTGADVTVDEYERTLASLRSPQKSEEESTMPKLNLKDEGFESEETPIGPEKPSTPPPTLRDVGGGESGGRTSGLLIGVVVLLVLAIATFALNYFQVIHLWGKKTPKVVESVQEPEGFPPQAPGELEPAPEQGATATGKAAEAAPSVAAPATTSKTPAKGKAKAEMRQEVTPPARVTGTGQFTVQVSSWTSRAKADLEASRLSSSGFGAFVEDAVIGETTWFRVRVGRFATSKEARAELQKLSGTVENGLWVARVGR